MRGVLRRRTFCRILAQPEEGKFTIDKEYEIHRWDLLTQQTIEMELTDDEGNKIWVYSAYTSPPYGLEYKG